MSAASISFQEVPATNPNGSTRISVNYSRNADGRDDVSIIVYGPRQLGSGINQDEARRLAQDLALLSSEILGACNDVDRMRRLADKALATMEEVAR